MRGEKQGDDECLLATVADLTDTPLAQVRATALAFLGKPSWKQVAAESKGDISDVYWKAVFYVCDIYDKTKRLPHVLIRASAEHQALAELCTAAKNLDPDMSVLPSKGRGVIVLKNTRSRFGHIAPWENGVVYDLDGNPGKDLIQFRILYLINGLYIYKISQENS